MPDPRAGAASAPSAARGTAAALPGQAERLLRQLEWTVIRRLDGLLQGDYRTLLRGGGLDLADLREYQPHDDVRHIDWNVTARLAVPHVRVFSEDREMAAWFLLDLSPSVDFGPPGQAKRDILAGFVAVLARLLTRHGNRVGAMLYGAGAAAPSATAAPASAGRAPGVDAILPPRASRAHVLHLLHRLLQVPGPAKAPPGATDLSHLLGTALGTVRRRSAVFVVSDFITAPGWEKPLAQLAQRHDVVAVRLLDPLELALPDVGLVTLRDPETGDQLQVDTRDKAFRHRFARLAAQREAALRESLARAGADTLELATGDDLLDALVRFMELRGRQPAKPAYRPPAPWHAAARAA
ncbi:DUF58 domain-containing protein [Acidovorax sp. SUPP3334]|uniref:DUF58 domain-containing protein n=1 Tax=Acidovorax sp. SUPP3334 TaxID=2920881 RepID=UPI0023DE3375|nr:DUF58 domain-containing protein [Acidovorax sp. SUPP3334]GKT22117.1 DUF58 domain-containing protein [Acidovorax sp. SUPP3334]